MQYGWMLSPLRRMMSIEDPLRNMITYVALRLGEYGITPTRMKRDDIDICLGDGIILQQTFEFKEEVSENDQDNVTRALDNAGWDTEWFTDGEYNTLIVRYDGYSFYEESYRHAQKSCTSHRI